MKEKVRSEAGRDERITDKWRRYLIGHDKVIGSSFFLEKGYLRGNNQQNKYSKRKLIT
jgi:hypothetical protein